MKERIWGVFHATGGRLIFATGTKGGVWHKKRGGVAAPHSLNSFVSCGLLRLFGFQNDDPEKFGETIATPPPPPERGVPTDPDSGAEWHASIPARRGSLSSVFIPAGRLGKDAPERGAERRRTDQSRSHRTVRRSPLCVSMCAMTIASFIALLVGPAFAVFLTRWLDERRVKRARRWGILRDLMCHRRNPLNPHFVGALNLLEVVFADDKEVTGAWKKLLKELNKVWPEKLSEEQNTIRNKDLHEAQTRLLSTVAENLGLSIEQLDIHGGYAPQGWFNWEAEAEQTQLRRLAIDIAEGSRALRVMSWDGEKYKPNKAP